MLNLSYPPETITDVERCSSVRCGYCLWLGRRTAITSKGEYRDVTRRPCPQCGGRVVLDMWITGGVYLLCFIDPVTLTPRRYPNGLQPGHYVGHVHPGRFLYRMLLHRAGLGSNLVMNAKLQGLTFAVMRTWPGEDKNFERRMKKRGPNRLCPLCKRLGDYWRPRV